MRITALIPVYNHGRAVGAVVAKLRAQGLAVLLVDDGSAAETAAELDRLAAADPAISLLRLAVNSGKGGAMIAGLRAAHAAGYSHALQIDADGQHDANDAPRFLAAVREQPLALVCGAPIYDETVPRGRLYGRYLTHVWVWINTLSFALRDSMCGFRVYPLVPTLAVIASETIGRRMDFDTEIAVRLIWRGLPVRNIETRVHYPADGISHFRMLQDNLRISAMHTRLFFGMLLRLPRLLAKKLS